MPRRPGDAHVDRRVALPVHRDRRHPVERRIGCRRCRRPARTGSGSVTNQGCRSGTSESRLGFRYSTRRRSGSCGCCGRSRARRCRRDPCRSSPRRAGRRARSSPGLGVPCAGTESGSAVAGTVTVRLPEIVGRAARVGDPAHVDPAELLVVGPDDVPRADVGVHVSCRLGGVRARPGAGYEVAEGGDDDRPAVDDARLPDHIGACARERPAARGELVDPDVDRVRVHPELRVIGEPSGSGGRRGGLVEEVVGEAVRGR